MVEGFRKLYTEGQGRDRDIGIVSLFCLSLFAFVFECSVVEMGK